MIIVMDNLNAAKPGADASLYAARTIIAKPTMARRLATARSARDRAAARHSHPTGTPRSLK